MPKIYEVINPMNPTKDMITIDVPVGFSTSDHVPRSLGLKYHISINNRPSFVPKKLHEGDVAIYVPCINGTVGIGIVIALITAVAIYFFLSSAVPANEGLPEADPVYSFRGQQNQIKEGEAIERHYGEVRHWPSYAARPYNQFIGDDQWLYALLCVGLGPCVVTDVMIDDTPIENFENAQYTIYQPGENVTLFPTNVVTSVEVVGLELLAPDEPEFDDWSGPFTIVQSGEKAYRIELDISFRQGLYKSNNSGEIGYMSATALFEIREIDDAGDPLGLWVELTEFTQNLKSTAQRRFTVSVNVADGRYEIRGKRTTDKTDDTKARSTLTWEGIRSFIKTEQNFGNVTLIAIKVQASKNLNENSRNKFNVRLQSKAWTCSSGVWSVEITRSPIWAACDMLIAEYGRNISKSFIDSEKMELLATEIEEEGIFFDGTFDSNGTVWQSITECLMSSRCKPNLPGTIFSIVRDSPLTIPTLCLNGHNIVAGSVKVSHEFSKIGGNDGLEVEYVDAETWERKSVLCLIGSEQGINPERVRLPGCKNRNVAYRWGMYMRATKTYQRTNVSVTTGLEGATVSIGDLVAMQHDLMLSNTILVPEHTGRISGDIVVGSGESAITLPFAPEFEDGMTHRIGLRKRNGELAGPFLCVQGEGNTVIIESEIDISDISTDSDEEGPTYFFGVTGKEVHLFKVVGITPADNSTVNLSLSPYDERLYAFSEEIAPPEGTPFNYPETSNTPVVTGVRVEQLTNSVKEAIVSWNPAIGAIDYIVERSEDGVDYERVGQFSSLSTSILITPGDLWVRVAAVGFNTGPWAYWDGEVGISDQVPFKPNTPSLSQTFDGNTLDLKSNTVPLADEYHWKIYVGATLILTKTTSTNSVSISSAEAKAGAIAASTTLERDIDVVLNCSNSAGTGENSDTFSTSNPTPSAATSLSAVGVQTIGANERCIFSWNSEFEIDLELYNLYGSTTTGFTPGPANLKTATTSISAEAIIATGVTFYWRVGTKDRWGTDLVFSAESSITP